MARLILEREAIFNKPRDEVWEYMSDIRRAMTLDLFHIAADCAPADAANIKTGLTVPITHRMLGFDHVRLGRVLQYADYAVAWGERIEAAEGGPFVDHDPFPHSEGWTFTEIDRNTCGVKVYMKGDFKTPVGNHIAPLIFDTMMVGVLDHDLMELATAVGAKASRAPEPIPDNSSQLLFLMMAQEINGMPAAEFLASAPPLVPDADPSLS